MGSGRADYALTSIRNGQVYVERWQNEDQGGTMVSKPKDTATIINEVHADSCTYRSKVRGDGTFYCDMTGDGSDDYIFINENGAITLFENNHNWGYWVPCRATPDARSSLPDFR